MCRIVGFWDSGSAPGSYDPAAVLADMRDSLAHGGPDAAGSYTDGEARLGLGHRRLSILELSDAGSQPMRYKHWVLVFNGEIYNFEEIRAELQAVGYAFVGGSDTEVLLKGYEHWGIDALLPRLRGMFAFALWDEQSRRLLLCRDRLGVKPLFWYHQPQKGLFLFASELKALHRHPGFERSINLYAVSLFLQQGYIRQPHCIFEGAQSLPGGHYMTLDAADRAPRLHRYWSALEAYAQPALKGSEAELSEELERLLHESFRLRMVADVPVGVFLSGGIDSSTVAALLQRQSLQPLQTFTIGFEDPAYDEAVHARAIAKHLGTEHHEWYCSEGDFAALLPRLVDLYDQPFGDSSAIPTHLVACRARELVKVSLSADGGDELFGGYTKYEAVERFYPRIRRLPRPLRSMLRGVLRLFGPLWLERNARYLPVLNRYKNLSNKLPKLIDALQAESDRDFFGRASSYLPLAELQKYHHLPVPAPALEWPDLETDPLRRIGYWGLTDMLHYLEGDILTKVDRATMGTALEGREPFLDHSLVEFALRLPDEWKIRQGKSKYLLRQVLYRYVPPELIERPKQGFSVPIAAWLAGPLRPELEALAHDQASDFEQTFGLRTGACRHWILPFLEGKRGVNPHFVWFLFMLRRWQQRWL